MSLQGEEKQRFVAEVMAEIATAEKIFKQLKAAANLAAQQGDADKARQLLAKIKKVV